jgi:hypothetical protein
VTLRELRKLKRGGVRPTSSPWAKENLKGNLILALDPTVSRMSAAARQEFYFGRSIPRGVDRPVENVTLTTSARRRSASSTAGSCR